MYQHACEHFCRARSRHSGYVKSARGAISWEAGGDRAATCLPSRLSRVRIPSPGHV